MVEENPLQNVTMSSADGPARIVIHGQGGTGKTTAGCFFSKPIIIGAEEGIPRDLGFTVPIVRPRSWPHMFDIIASLTTDPHDYETGVVDTADWVEPLSHAYVCDRDSNRETEMNKKGKPLISIEDYGFARGFLCAEEEWVRLLNAIDVLQYRRRMNWVFLVHTNVRPFKNPMGPDYDRYELKTQARVSAKLFEWAETVAFLHFRRDASKISEDKERGPNAKAKAVEGVGQRLVGLQDSALYDAKNRVRLPPVIPMPANPNEFVSMLLGDHLRSGVAALADRETRTSSTRPAPPPQQKEPPPPPRNDPPPSHPSDFVSRSDRNELNRSGHDERTMAMDRGEYGAVVDIADHRKTTRVEQPPPAQQKPPPHQAAANAQRADNAMVEDLMTRLAAAIVLGTKLGPGYREEMKLWLERAGATFTNNTLNARSANPDYVEAIIKRIHANVEEARQRQQQPPQARQ